MYVRKSAPVLTTLGLAIVASLTNSVAAVGPTFTASQVYASTFNAQALGPAIATRPDSSVGATWWIQDPDASTFSVGLGLAEGSGSSFVASVVTTSDDAYPSIAYDSSGVAHIAAYVNGGGGGLVEVDDADGTITETLVTADPQNDRPSIAVAPTGAIKIAYAAGGDNPGVYVAVNAGTGWSITQVAAAFAIGPRINIDAAGRTHVVWVEIDPNTGVASGIQYATDASGTFVRSAATTGPFDSSPDVDVDGAGIVHIVFTRNTARNAALLELRGNPGHWRTVRLVRGPTDTPDIELDAADRVHVAYFSAGDVGGAIRYLTNASGHFVDVPVANGNPGFGLAVTPTGTGYIAYTVPGTGANPGGLFIAHD